MKKSIGMLGMVASLCAFAENQYVDISAAVRESGLTPVYSVTVNGSDAPSAYATGQTAFNGVWDDNADVFLLKKADSDFPTYPLVITYAMPAAFYADGKVVVKEIVFRTGHGPSGVGTKWGDCQKRQVAVVDVEGSQDGVSWTKLHTGVSGEIAYAETTLPDVAGDKNFYYADSTLTLANNRSYRQYRLTIRASGDSYNAHPVIFNEVMLRGEVGELGPFSGDVTAEVLSYGLTPSFSATVNGEDVDADHHTCFNGTWGYYEGSTWKWQQDRLLVAKATGFPATYPLVVTYDVPEGFYPGKNVVVTGLTFRIGPATTGPGSQWGDYNTRLPTDVKVEGRNDGGDWTPIARCNGGALSYAEHTWTDTSHPDKVGQYWYSEKKADFYNETSYRHYRITVLNTGLPNDTYPLQIGEVALLGSCGFKKPRPVMREGDITEAVRRMGLETTVACSTHTPHEGAGFVGASGLADGLLSRFGESGSQRYFIDNTEANRTTPLVLNVEIPDSFCAAGDVVVTGLTFEVGGTVKPNQTDPEVRDLYGDAQIRLPTAFALEASSDGTAWRELCSTNGFKSSGYVTVMHTHKDAGTESADYMRGTFSFANGVSARKYRITLRASDVITQGLTSNAGIYQLSEIQLHGLFGNRPNGMTVLIK